MTPFLGLHTRRAMGRRQPAESNNGCFEIALQIRRTISRTLTALGGPDVSPGAHATAVDDAIDEQGALHVARAATADPQLDAGTRAPADADVAFLVHPRAFAVQEAMVANDRHHDLVAAAHFAQAPRLGAAALLCALGDHLEDALALHHLELQDAPLDGAGGGVALAPFDKLAPLAGCKEAGLGSSRSLSLHSFLGYSVMLGILKWMLLDSKRCTCIVINSSGSITVHRLKRLLSACVSVTMQVWILLMGLLLIILSYVFAFLLSSCFQHKAWTLNSSWDTRGSHYCLFNIDYM